MNPSREASPESKTFTRSVLSSGYVALDVIIDSGAIGHRAGGTAANVAANLAFFGWRSQVTAVCGEDPAGRHLESDLRRAGVDTRHLVMSHEASTPVVVHEVLSTSHRFRFGCPSCGRKFPRYRTISPSDAQQLSDQLSPDVFFFDRVSLGTLGLATSVRDQGGLVVFEPATRGRAAHFTEALRIAHIVKTSDERMDALRERLNQFTNRHQLQVRTHGSQGASWRVGAGRWRKSEGFSAEVVDAGGAGDWATAALINALPSLDPDLLLNADIGQALQVSQAVAAVSCRSRGARGITQVMTRRQLVDEANRLLRDIEPTKSASNPLRRSRRQAHCSACLAAA